MKNLSSRIRGFSLLELLVVMLIIGIVATFLVPAASTILRGSQLNQASQIVFDQFNLARQYALSSNHPVEVRLICYADPEVPGEVTPGSPSNPANGKFRAIQILDTLDAINPTTNDFVRVAVDKPQLLPQGIVMDAPQNFPGGTVSSSTLINEAKIANSASNPTVTPTTVLQPTALDPTLPRGVGLNYYYVAFRFMPDGSTNLPAASVTDTNGAWYVTLHNLTDPMGSIKPPANFFTLQVDPVSGTLKQYRPGLVY